MVETTPTKTAERRRQLSGWMTRALTRVITRSAHQRCAKAVCYGCRQGWPLTADKTAHVVPGQKVLFECSAAEIWKITP